MGGGKQFAGGREMKPEEFTSFKDSQPKKNKHLIVTNNIKAKNAHGEMSHVWLTTFWCEASSESPNEGIVSFDDADRRLLNLSHWKYA